MSNVELERRLSVIEKRLGRIDPQTAVEKEIARRMESIRRSMKLIEDLRQERRFRFFTTSV